MWIERSESQRLKALAGNSGLKPVSKPPVRRVVMIYNQYSLSKYKKLI
jgi:hypothetical protein